MKTINIKYTIIITLLLSFFSLSATTFDSDIVHKAIKKEIDRSLVELKKDSLAKPFFINLLVTNTYFRYGYFTSFGKNSYEYTDSIPGRFASTRLLVGDYHRTQPIYNTRIFLLPIENDETAIRTAIWVNLDDMYKQAAVAYVDKMAKLKQQNLTEEEKKIDNFEKRETTTYFAKERKKDRDFSVPKKMSLKIGAYLYELVKKEKLEVENASTSFWFINQIKYYYDTEKSEYKYYIHDGYFNISLNGVNDRGEDIVAYRTYKMNEVSKFPSEKKLKEDVKKIVEEYKIKLKAQKLEDPYMGPVLIVNDKVQNVATEIVRNLRTSPKTTYSNGNPYQNMPGIRVISKQLSMRMDYGKNGEKMDGVKIDLTPIDEEAVIPPDSLVLIKNGILKNMLTSRQPVKNYPKSNGSVETKSVLTVTGNEQYSYPEIKKMLIEEAKLQGLTHTYIINGDGEYHIKINVETGEETPFLASVDLGQTMKSMRRVMGVDKEMKTSADGTIRYPASILLEDVEITIEKVNQRLKKDFVPRPKL